MKLARHLRSAIIHGVLAIFSIAFFAGAASAQTPSLRGQVTDQNGAMVLGAKVTVHGQITKNTTTDSSGSYSFTNLPAGDYTIEASAPSLVLQEPIKITLKSGSRH